MADIKGIDSLTPGELAEHVARGGKFVVYSYALSFLVVSLKRSSAVHFIKPGESAVGKSLPYTLLSLFLGWWGLPWGFIYTPWAIIQNLGGGTDVTPQVLAALGAPSPTGGGFPTVTVK